MENEIARPIDETLTTKLVLRHESTSCKAEQALIIKSLQEQRRTLLTVSTNLALEKNESESGKFYRRYKHTCKALKTLTGNAIYDRF